MDRTPLKCIENINTESVDRSAIKHIPSSPLDEDEIFSTPSSTHTREVAASGEKTQFTEFPESNGISNSLLDLELEDDDDDEILFQPSVHLLSKKSAEKHALNLMSPSSETIETPAITGLPGLLMSSSQLESTRSMEDIALSPIQAVFTEEALQAARKEGYAQGSEESGILQLETASLQKRIQKEKENNLKLKGMIKQYEATIQKLVDDSSKVSSNKVATLEAEKVTLQKDKTDLTTAFTALKKRYEDLKLVVVSLQGNESKLKDAITAYQSQLDAADSRYDELKKLAEGRLHSAGDEATTLRAEVSEKEKQLQAELCKVSELGKQLAEKEAGMKAAVEDHQNALMQVENEKSQVAATTKMVENLTKQLQMAKTATEGEITNKKTLEEACAQLQKERDEAIARSHDTASLRSQLRLSNDEMSRLKEALGSFRDENATLKVRVFDLQEKLAHGSSDEVATLKLSLEASRKENAELTAMCDELLQKLEEQA